MGLQPVPGMRVSHRSGGYEGWVDDPPLTGNGLCRVRIHGQRERKLVSITELACCNDSEKVFRSTQGLLHKVIESQSDDRRINERLRHWCGLLSLPCAIWALDRYDPSNGGDPVKLVKDAELYSELIISRFFPKLENILNVGVPIVVVPSHKAGEYNQALWGLVRKLVETGRVDATSSLRRYKTIESSRLSSDGTVDRYDIRRHLESIKVDDAGSLSKKVVLLFDDVVTSGTTFMACRKLLLDAGAAEVVCLALGWTKRRTRRQKPTLRVLPINLKRPS